MNAGARDREEADRLLRLLVRKRGSCERCGKPGEQVAHIIRRGLNATRCDERNVWWLDADCHRTVDAYPIARRELIAKSIGLPMYTELLWKAQRGPQQPLSAFWEAEVERLRERCEEEGVSWTH